MEGRGNARLIMGHRTKRLMLRSVDFDESLLISVS